MNELLEAEKANYSMRMMCRALGVARSAVYERRTRRPSKRDREDRTLTTRIKLAHRASDGVYGSPRVHEELRQGHGIRVARKRVERLMREMARRPSQEALPSDHRLKPRPVDYRESGATEFSSVEAQRSLGLGHHVPESRLVVCLLGRRHRPVLSSRRRLVVEPDAGVGVCLSSVDEGDLSAPSELRHGPSLRPRYSVYESCVSLDPAVLRYPREHESSWRLLGQRSRGELLCDPREGAGVEGAVVDLRAGTCRSDPVHRGFLQPAPKAFDAQLRHSTGRGAGLAAGEKGSINTWSGEAGELQTVSAASNPSFSQ